MCQGLPGGAVVKNPSSNAGDVGSIPGWGTKIPTCHTATDSQQRAHERQRKPSAAKKQKEKSVRLQLDFLVAVL